MSEGPPFLPPQYSQDSQVLQQSQSLWFTSQSPPVHRDSIPRLVPLPHSMNYSTATYSYQPRDSKITENTHHGTQATEKKSLSSLTQEAIRYLQVKGTASMQDMEQHANLDYRRGYEILQVLTSLGIVEKTKNEGQTTYRYLSEGKAVDPIILTEIIPEIERLQNNILFLDSLVELLDQQLITGYSKLQCESIRATIETIAEEFPDIDINL
ncbi:hypothetical protein RCL1_003309 [Eukaryota sp. TZLM3-RCL]